MNLFHSAIDANVIHFRHLANTNTNSGVVEWHSTKSELRGRDLSDDGAHCPLN